VNLFGVFGLYIEAFCLKGLEKTCKFILFQFHQKFMKNYSTLQTSFSPVVDVLLVCDTIWTNGKILTLQRNILYILTSSDGVTISKNNTDIFIALINRFFFTSL
jgi:hypothetical protein